MFTLVIGGSASGKSEYAEQQVMALPGRRWYLATMEPWDDECVARIAKHQAARAQQHTAEIARHHARDVGQPRMLQHLKGRQARGLLRFAIIGIANAPCGTRAALP